MLVLAIINAQFNDKYKWIPNTYVNMKQGTRTKYQQMAVIARTSDNQFVYCIEPGTPLEEFTDYTGTDVNQAYVANMSQEQWKRIQLLAFYGYGYSDSEVNHSDLKVCNYSIYDLANCSTWLGYLFY